MTLKNLRFSPSPIVSAGDGPITIVNRDLVNEVLYGPDSGIVGGNPSEVSLLDPQASVTLPGDSDVYATTAAAGLTATIDIIPGATGYTNPVGVALSLSALGLATAAGQATGTAATNATTTAVGAGTTATNAVKTALGTPAQTVDVNGVSSTLTGGAQLTGLLAATVGLFKATAVNLPALGAVVHPAPLIPVTVNSITNGCFAGYISYELSISLTLAAGGTGTGAVNVTIDFYENPTDTVPVDSVVWTVPAQKTNAQVTIGKGALRGQYVVVSMSNPDTSGAVTVNSFIMNGTSRTNVKDDWRSINNGNAMPSWPNALGDSRQNLVGYGIALSHGVGTILTRQLSVYSGKVRVFINITGLTTNQDEFQLLDLATLQVLKDSFLGASGTTQLDEELTLGRSTYIMQFHNNSSVVGSVTFSVIAEE